MPGNKMLLVMRHAKSSWKTNEPDPRRPLSGRGVRDAVVAGQTLAQYAPDVVWCSSAARAQQTWQSAQMGGATCPEVRVRDQLYGASADELLEVLRTSPASARTVLLIGHEPGVSDLVLSLAAPSALTAQVEVKFPTSGIAALTHSLDWDEMSPEHAQLIAFTIPRG